MKVHPAAELFPMMTDVELSELAVDIQKNGQLEPIVLWEGAVLDGRNRQAACKLAKVQAKSRELKRLPPMGAVGFVWSANAQRRHLTPPQKAAIAADMVPLLEKDARARQKVAGTKGGKTAGNGRAKASEQTSRKPTASERASGESAVQAAKLTGAGVAATKAMVAVKKEAPEVFDAVKAGAVKTVADAKRIAEAPVEIRAEIIADVRGGVPAKEAVRAATSKPSNGTDESRFNAIIRSLKESAPHAERLNNCLLSVVTNIEKLGITKMSGMGTIRLGYELVVLEETLSKLHDLLVV